MAYKQLKYWFDKDLAIFLANKIIAIEPTFKKKEFVNSVDEKVKNKELKDRVETIADELYNLLGSNYKNSISILVQILGPENQKETGMFKEFYWVMPIAKLVEKYGLDDFITSIKVIEEITKRNTGEYTIRPFLETNQIKTLTQVEKWSKNKNKHIRRLASEGIRPRLPWAKKLDIFIENPKPLIPILNNLKDDESKYVQKSVANCLNDIFKDNVEIGKQIIESWNTSNISPQRKWIIKHSLRTLIKREDSWAINLKNNLINE